MLIVCPNCASTYSLTEQQLGRGRTLRCANCRHTWFATAPMGADAADAAVPLPEEASAPAEPALAMATAGAGPRPRKPIPRRAAKRATSPGVLARLKPFLKPVNLIAAALVVVVATGIVQRVRIVRLLPQTARLFAAIGLPVNLRGVEFTALRSGLVQDSDQSALVVEGEIRNVTRAPVTLPSLSVDLRGAAGQTLYSWTAEPPKTSLAPGETAGFRTRLASPPADGHDVVVRFASAAPGSGEPAH